MKANKITPRLLIFLNVIDMFGSSITWAGLPTFAFLATGSPLFTSVLFMATAIASILTTIFGGYIVDQFKHSKIILTSYACSIFIFSILIFIIHYEKYYLMVPLVILNSMANSISSIAHNIWINSLSDEGQLVQQISARNSLFLTSKTIGFALGPMVFTMLMEKALIIDLITYVICFCIMFGINKKIPTIQKKSLKDKKGINALKQLKDSFLHVGKVKLLRELSILESINGMITPTIISISVYILTLKYNASLIIFSSFWVIGGIGAILANIILAKIKIYEASKTAFLFVNHILVVGGMLLMTLANDAIWYLIGFSLFTLGTPIINNILRAEIFTKAPVSMKAQYKGITMALSDVCKLICLPLSYVLIDSFGVTFFLSLFTFLSFIRINYSFFILISKNKNFIKGESKINV